MPPFYPACPMMDSQIVLSHVLTKWTWFNDGTITIVIPTGSACTQPARVKALLALGIVPNDLADGFDSGCASCLQEHVVAHDCRSLNSQSSSWVISPVFNLGKLHHGQNRLQSSRTSIWKSGATATATGEGPIVSVELLMVTLFIPHPLRSYLECDPS